MFEMRTLKKIGLHLVVLLCAATALLSYNNSRDIRFRHLSLEEGLSQSLVFCILQDSKGFMWFGTQDGLNKYDGYNFTIYRPQPENPSSVNNNTILVLYEDRRGTLWVGTAGSGLDRFDRETEEFIHHRNNPNDPGSLGNDFVQAILEDRSGGLWVGTAFGLDKFHPETGTFTHYRNIRGNPNSLSGNVINSIHEDREGTLWIGTTNGLNKFDPRTAAFDRYQVEPGNPYSLSNNVINSIYEDHSGEFWIGTVDGLNRLDRGTGVFTVYRNDPAEPQSLSSSIINVIYEDHSGVLWVATADRGLNTFDRRSERFTHYRNTPNDPASLSSDFISSIYEDRSGVLWIGTNGAGINQFDRETGRFRYYAVDPNSSNTLSLNFVYSFCEDRFGHLWIATNGGGLNRFDPGKQQFTYYRANPARSGSLSSDLVFCILEDRAGVIWVGTNGGGLNRFNRETGTFKVYTNRPNDITSLSNNVVRVLFEDSQRVFWAGTAGGGLNRFDREKEQFTRYQNIPGDPGSISDNSIRVIYEDRNRQLWIGNSFTGLNKFNRETGTFAHYRRQPDNPNSLSNDNVQCIYQAPDGIYWIGTFGGGLNKYDARQGTWTHYREKDGLPNDVVYGILADEKENLWLSTNKGLSKFNPSTGVFKNFTTRDGLQSNEFNGGSYYKSRSGEMFFGGINGFNAFYPPELKDNKNIPPVVISDFQVFNKPVGIGGESPLKKHISETDQIILSHKQNVFSFKFVALDYTIPEKNRYRYMMEGFDNEWISTDAARRFASYTNLDPGEYVFRVIGSNNDGAWNEKGASIRIKINPPFWKTWWFRLLAVITAILLIAAFFKLRLKIIAGRTRMEAELLAAHTAQMSIMPQSDPQVQGFYISGICVPAYEVGGDFFDYIWLNPEQTRLGIAIGDVAGKAMKAAMTAVMSSGILYSKIDSGSSVKEIMTQTNRPLYFKTDRKMFTALCLAGLDLRTKEFIFTNAGLSEPLLKSGNSAVYIESVGPRFPLGTFKDNIYQEATLQLKLHDVIVLFTDGIPEARNHNGEFYGYDALRKLVEAMDTSLLTAVEIKNIILADVKRFSGHVPQRDDMTVVVIKYQGH